MVEDVGNQQQYRDTLNYEMDIDELYKRYIKNTDPREGLGIDDIRSYTNIDKINKESLFASIEGSVKAKSPFTINPEPDLQESRCHAFYRIIGFPVVADGINNFYNPGHSPKDLNIKITLEDKLNIARNQIEGFEKLSDARERFFKSNNAIFSNRTSLKAAIWTLTSGSKNTQNANLREFDSPFKKSTDAFDMDPNNQRHNIGTFSLVEGRQVLLKEYEDKNGGLNGQTISTSRLHIIKPFIVDARIDFAVRPSTRRIAVPFVPDNSYLQVSTNAYTLKPIIEEIITNRFLVTDQKSKAGDSEKRLIDAIKSIDSIKDESIIKDITSGDIYKLDEKIKFSQYLGVIQAMMIHLSNAIKHIEKAQSLYYWLPIPSKIGPEGGCSVRDPFFTDKTSRVLVTNPDFEILTKLIQTEWGRLNVKATQATGTPVLQNFSFSNNGSSFDPTSTPAMGDAGASTLETQLAKRKSILEKANASLRTIEIIMGEFSGFGICDIVAIMGALYIMPRENLLSFLDEDARDRAKTYYQIPVPTSVPSLSESMDILSATVDSFYKLMDKIYEDTTKRNIRTASS